MKKTLLLTSFVIICFISMSFRGCVIITHPTPSGDLVRIHAAGKSLYPPGEHNVFDTLFYSIFVGNNGRIVRSTGRTNIVFQQMTSGTTQQLNFLRLSNDFFLNNVAVVGNNGTVLVSSNTGLNWAIKPPITGNNLNAVDHNHWLFAVGDNGTILFANEMYTANLVAQSSGTTRNLRGVAISTVSFFNIITVGDKGTILRSTNTGNNWQNVSISDTTFNFYAISQKSANQTVSGDRFIAVGSGGRIYKSTDIGATWQQKTSGTTNTLRSVYFTNLDSGVVVGDNGTIRLTTNGGETWFTDPLFNSPSARNYNSVSCLDKENNTYFALSDSLHIVSNEAMILGINNISSEIPDRFSLSQNYPNPFNPSTKIRFELPKGAFAKLIVYDITGREIETLVNKNLHAGTYEYEWSGINLPSGVYFYKLISEDFIETKKMVLVK